MPRGNPKNLIKNSDLTPEELRQKTSNGGKKSGKVRREKKLMSQIYADFLIDKYAIGKENFSGHEVLARVMQKVLARGDSASVSLMREIREATEGSKIKTETTLSINTDDEKVAQVLKEYGVNKPKSEN